jgi:hypothetical protein
MNFEDSSPESKKLHLPLFFSINELCIRNNVRTAKELGLEVKLEIVNDELKVTLNDPTKPRRKRFYECRDDNYYRRTLSRLRSLYK